MDKYVRSVTTAFEGEPLLRFAYVYNHLGNVFALGSTGHGKLSKGKRFQLSDAHGSKIQRNTFPELRAAFNSPTFDVCRISGDFVMYESTLGLPDGYAEIHATEEPTGDRFKWNLEVRITSEHEGRTLGGIAQAEKTLSQATAMNTLQLKEETAFLFGEPRQDPLRKFFARVVEGVVSNLLSTAVVGGAGLVLGWVAGRAIG